MGYTTFTRNENYGPRKGLEGPFTYPNGRVVYYDPLEGQYWDPKTDFYLSHEEAGDLQACIFKALKG